MGNWSRIGRSACAGALGGLAGSLVMRLLQAAQEGVRGMEQQRSPQGMREQNSGEGSRDSQEQDPTVRVATGLWHTFLRRHPGPREKAVGGSFVHYAFGTTTGALYGAVAEIYPAASVGWGIPFGTAVWLGADVALLPLSGLSKPPAQVPVSTHARMFGLHVAYGLTSELVRRALRKSGTSHPLTCFL